jgi:choline-sulfatase
LDLPKYGRELESADHPYAGDLRAHFQTDLFTEAQVRGLRRGYLGNVTFIDRQLGRLLDLLQERGLADTTNV